MTAGAGVAARTRALVKRWWGSRRTREYLVALGIIAVLEAVVFWSYFDGTAAPPWDFYGAYSAEAHAYWRDLVNGNLDHGWVPYEFAGYPAGVALQNSSWYLPIAIPALLWTYTIDLAAILLAVHVAFGSFGAFILARRLGLRYSAQVFVLTAFFFMAPFYSNAEHPDIVRAMAWTPWLVWLCSPYFPWGRRWAIPVAGLLFWQALVGSYPGVLVAWVYTLPFLVLAYQWMVRLRLKEYLIPLAVSLVSAGLLCVPKYLPGFDLRVPGFVNPDGSEFPLYAILTFFFRYNGDLPGDISMRPFFIPITCFVVIGLVGLWKRSMVPFAALLGGAVAFGMPFVPWYDATLSLPLMSLSRVRMPCFRLVLLFALLMLAAIVFSRLTERPIRLLSPRRRWATAAGLGIVVVGVAGVGMRTMGAVDLWIVPWTMALLAALACLAVGLGRESDTRRGAVLVLLALTAASGIEWLAVNTSPQPSTIMVWRVGRMSQELGWWGTTAEELASRYPGPDMYPKVQREGRRTVVDPTAWHGSYAYDASFYTGQDSLGGTSNLRGQPAREAMMAAVEDEATSEAALAILTAPGIGVEVPEPQAIPDQSQVERCLAGGDCGPGVELHPVSYVPGQLVYDVATDHEATMLFNEAYYRGWQVEACPAGGGGGGTEPCRALEARLGGAGLVETDVPQGSWRLTLTYVLPHWHAYLVIFALGILLALAPAALPRRTKRSGRAAVNGPLVQPSEPR
jgi:hypothetical protein